MQFSKCFCGKERKLNYSLKKKSLAEGLFYRNIYPHGSVSLRQLEWFLSKSVEDDLTMQDKSFLV